jgi:hypothetical protein
MSRFSRLRQWVNRDDGRHYQVGNRNLGTLEAIGLVISTCSVFLWQLHSEIGVGSMWAYGAGLGGFLLALLGLCRTRRRPGA